MMKQTIPQAVMIAVTLALVAAPARASWTTLAPGLDLGDFALPSAAPGQAKAALTILRVDAARWSLELLSVDDVDAPDLMTARQWCEQHDLVAAINAGMFAVDFRTHVGFAAVRGRVLCEVVNDYQSVAAFHPFDGRGRAPFRIFDLDEPGVTLAGIRRDYGSVVQNLRLIKRPGDNRWQRQDRRWSEAALAEDAQGRILFVFCRAPLTMHDFNEALLGLGIGVVAAQHLDGGPPAQMFVRVGDVERELVGSYETGVRQDEGNVTAWPIPIVLGVRRR
ncbi:MAG: phosphodiester glycosidase family protein [bacterium]|nr:phosphodiester glycosidase family protein [bacterium]